MANYTLSTALQRRMPTQAWDRVQETLFPNLAPWIFSFFFFSPWIFSTEGVWEKWQNQEGHSSPLKEAIKLSCERYTTGKEHSYLQSQGGAEKSLKSLAKISLSSLQWPHTTDLSYPQLSTVCQTGQNDTQFKRFLRVSISLWRLPCKVYIK